MTHASDLTQTHIRPVGPDELFLLREIAERTFRAAFEAQNKPSDTDMYVAQALSMSHIQDAYETPQSRFFFVESDDTPCGYLKLNHGAAQTEPFLPQALEIERLYLDVCAQGQGLGTQLMEFSEKLAQSEGRDWLWLGVWDQNFGAARFYRRHGFATFDTHDFLYGETRQRDLMMRKLIEPRS